MNFKKMVFLLLLILILPGFCLSKELKYTVKNEPGEIGPPQGSKYAVKHIITYEPIDINSDGIKEKIVSVGDGSVGNHGIIYYFIDDEHGNRLVATGRFGGFTHRFSKIINHPKKPSDYLLVVVETDDWDSGVMDYNYYQAKIYGLTKNRDLIKIDVRTRYKYDTFICDGTLDKKKIQQRIERIKREILNDILNQLK